MIVKSEFIIKDIYFECYSTGAFSSMYFIWLLCFSSRLFPLYSPHEMYIQRSYILINSNFIVINVLYSMLVANQLVRPFEMNIYVFLKNQPLNFNLLKTGAHNIIKKNVRFMPTWHKYTAKHSSNPAGAA